MFDVYDTVFAFMQCSLCTWIYMYSIDNADNHLIWQIHKHYHKTIIAYTEKNVYTVHN